MRIDFNNDQALTMLFLSPIIQKRISASFGNVLNNSIIFFLQEMVDYGIYDSIDEAEEQIEDRLEELINILAVPEKNEKNIDLRPFLDFLLIKNTGGQTLCKIELNPSVDWKLSASQILNKKNWSRSDSLLKEMN